MTAAASEPQGNVTHSKGSDDHHHHADHTATSSRGRMLFGHPRLLQDWDRESDHAFQYWELFLDLLLVAASSSVTDQFKEHLTFAGLGEFVLFAVVLINGWLLYTHHITSRYHDNSLTHSLVLFLYIVGFGIAMVNTGYDHVRAFCWGGILQRASILLMLTSVTMCLPRSKYTNATIGLITAGTMVLLLIVALGGDDIENSPIFMTIFWIAAGTEFLAEFFMVTSKLLQGQNLVPINIEQSKERLGAMVLVCLGETVLSVTIIYREMLSEGEIGGHESGEGGGGGTTHAYYWVLVFSFLLIFMFLLLYFHMQPSPVDHALRRSRWHGTSLMVVHKVLSLAVLAVGVSVKLVVESVLSGEELPVFASQLMGYGVGVSILILFGMRYLHYGGKDCINFDTLVMYYGVDPRLDRITTMWWWTVGLAGFLPIVGALTGFTAQCIQDPLILTGAHASLMFALVVIESYYAHVIQSHLSRKETAFVDDEHEKLMPEREVGYQT